MEMKDNHSLSPCSTDGFFENVKLNSKSNFHTEHFPDKITKNSNLENNQTTIEDPYVSRFSMTEKKLRGNINSIRVQDNKEMKLPEWNISSINEISNRNLKSANKKKEVLK